MHEDIEDMMTFFNTPTDYYLFALLHADGELRSNMLGITPAHYHHAPLAEQWYHHVRHLVAFTKRDVRVAALKRLESLYQKMAK